LNQHGEPCGIGAMGCPCRPCGAAPGPPTWMVTRGIRGVLTGPRLLVHRIWSLVVELVM
jgi:hypothetical protein